MSYLENLKSEKMYDYLFNVLQKNNVINQFERRDEMFLDNNEQLLEGYYYMSNKFEYLHLNGGNFLNLYDDDSYLMFSDIWKKGYSYIQFYDEFVKKCCYIRNGIMKVKKKCFTNESIKNIEILTDFGIIEKKQKIFFSNEKPFKEALMGLFDSFGIHMNKSKFESVVKSLSDILIYDNSLVCKVIG